MNERHIALMFTKQFNARPLLGCKNVSGKKTFLLGQISHRYKELVMGKNYLLAAIFFFIQIHSTLFEFNDYLKEIIKTFMFCKLTCFGSYPGTDRLLQ